MFFNKKMFFNEIINEKFNFLNDNNYQLLRNNNFSSLNDVTSLFSFFIHWIKSFKHFYFKIFIKKKREQNDNKNEFIKINDIIF